MAANLGLGTVQFGVDYGVSNQAGKTTDSDVGKILQMANMGGISVIDTASLYGDSERVLGRHNLDVFNVVTKTPRFSVRKIESAHVNELIECFNRSLSHLNLSNTYGLLSHHIEDLLVPGGEALWNAMLKFKDKGMVNRIGASVYEGWQIDELLDRYEPDIVQLPINVLDQRLIIGGQLERLHARGVEIHARSVFLQGLLLLDVENTPGFFAPIRQVLDKWRLEVNNQGMTLAQAALVFVRDLPEIDVVLVGVNDEGQLGECMSLFNKDQKFDASELHCNDSLYLNPARWEI